MTYSILKLLHIVGYILIGAGLVGVFVADLRSHQTRNVRLMAEAIRYVAIFYNGVVFPGAILAGITGFMLMLALDLGFFQIPWLTGMWALYVFEFVEGNTITRNHFGRLLRLSRAALKQGGVTAQIEEEMRRKLPRFTHYLDLPLFLVIVSLGGLRPSTWDHFAMGTLLALMLAIVLTLSLRYARRPLARE